MIIDKKKFPTFIILEKINQPKLKLTFYYNFGYYNFGWELTTEIVINDRNYNKLFDSISDCQIATEMVFINPNYDHWQGKFTTFIILEKMNQPKLKLTFYYNFGYYNFGWELTTEIVINDRNCNKLFYSISDCQIATEMVFINPNYDHWQEKIHKFHHFGKDESTEIEINFLLQFRLLQFRLRTDNRNCNKRPKL